MTWRIAFTGQYDRPLQQLIRRYIEPDTLVLDIGAALGLWTVPLATFARSVNSEVWAFEPHPANLRWLELSVERNACTNVSICPVALGDSDGVVRMDAGEGLDGGNVAVVLDRDAPGIEVDSRRLDDVPRPKRVSFIKIDVEGFELAVLRGASALIAADRPTILGEFEPHWLEARNEALNPWLEKMRDLGYTVQHVEHRRARPWLAAEQIRINESASDSGDLLLTPKPFSR